MFHKLITLLLLVSFLTACKNQAEITNEIAFVVESHCESEVKDFFVMLSKTDALKTKLVPTAKHSMFNSINYIGVIQSADSSIDLEPYVYGAKKNCGSKKTGTFSKDGPVKLDPHIYEVSSSQNKTIFIEVTGNNAKVHQ